MARCALPARNTAHAAPLTPGRKAGSQAEDRTGSCSGAGCSAVSGQQAALGQKYCSKTHLLMSCRWGLSWYFQLFDSFHQRLKTTGHLFNKQCQRVFRKLALHRYTSQGSCPGLAHTVWANQKCKKIKMVCTEKGKNQACPKH